MDSRKTWKGKELRLVLEPDNPLSGEEQLLLFHSARDREVAVNSCSCSESSARKISMVHCAGWNISPCHSRARATGLLSHLITHLGPRLWFKNISIKPVPLVWLVGVEGGGVYFVLVFSNFMKITWLHPCAALKDSVYWYPKSKVKLRGGQSPGNEHSLTLLWTETAETTCLYG